MINFEEYLLERKGSVVNKEKRKVTEAELRQMVKNKDSSISDVDVSDVKDMSYLFRNKDFGGSWTADLSGWDTSKVENMEAMFSGCPITKVELLDTSKVKDMYMMFQGCTKLSEVILPNTENVTNMNSMFYGCTSLKEVTLSHTESVKNMEWMFKGCSDLVEVKIINIKAVEKMGGMFFGCTKLEQDFSSWNIEGKRHDFMFEQSNVTKFPKGI